MSSRANEPTVVIGAGPAGLMAAFELGRLGRTGVVYEADELNKIPTAIAQVSRSEDAG